MYFDDNRTYDETLHCPPQYAREAYSPGNTSPDPDTSGGGWLRHEWRSLIRVQPIEGQRLVCIHCRTQANPHGTLAVVD